MDLIDALLAEHGLLYGLFDQLEESASRPTTRAGAGDAGTAPGDAATVIGKAVLAHAELEDDLLFSRLETRIGPEGPLAVMRAEHEEIHRALEETGKAAEHVEAQMHALRAVRLARDHFAKEEQVLFPMARQALGAEELERLSRRWAEARNVTLG